MGDAWINANKAGNEKISTTLIIQIKFTKELNPDKPCKIRTKIIISLFLCEVVVINHKSP